MRDESERLILLLCEVLDNYSSYIQVEAARFTILANATEANSVQNQTDNCQMCNCISVVQIIVHFTSLKDGLFTPKLLFCLFSHAGSVDSHTSASFYATG